MSSILPPPVGPDWKVWARQVTSYIGNAASNLLWKTDAARPAQNGTILWDEVLKTAVISIDGEWVPLGMDYAVYIAEQEIYNTYGDRVSVAQKKKTLTKFGRHPALSTSIATVWELGTDIANETYCTTNAIDSISSTDNADTVEIYLEGHTVSGTGADAQYTFVSQTVTLTGQTRAALTTSLARVSRAYVNSSSAVAGDVFIYENTALTAGKPTDMTKAHISIKGTSGYTQSYKAATTFSNTDYAIITGGYVALDKKAAANADFVLEVRRPGGVFRPAAGRIALSTNGTNTIQINFNPYAIVPKNSDVRVRAIGSTSGVEVDAAFQAYLAKVI